MGCDGDGRFLLGTSGIRIWSAGHGLGLEFVGVVWCHEEWMVWPHGVGRLKVVLAPYG